VLLTVIVDKFVDKFGGSGDKLKGWRIDEDGYQMCEGMKYEGRLR